MQQPAMQASSPSLSEDGVPPFEDAPALIQHLEQRIEEVRQTRALALRPEPSQVEAVALPITAILDAMLESLQRELDAARLFLAQ